MCLYKFIVAGYAAPPATVEVSNEHEEYEESQGIDYDDTVLGQLSPLYPRTGKHMSMKRRGG
jgi:hypothetical protein